MKQASKPITELLDKQGRIEPGTPGLWKVWGACARHIRVDDMVMLKWPDDPEHYEYEVAKIEPAKTPWNFRLTSKAGETVVVGDLQPIILMRMDTHHMLA